MRESIESLPESDWRMEDTKIAFDVWRKRVNDKKYRELARLQAEGREREFRTRQAILKKHYGYTRTEAFWIAVCEFPPIAM